jgi:hypothetical protein
LERGFVGEDGGRADHEFDLPSCDQVFNVAPLDLKRVQLESRDGCVGSRLAVESPKWPAAFR